MHLKLSDSELVHAAAAADAELNGLAADGYFDAKAVCDADRERRLLESEISRRGLRGII